MGKLGVTSRALSSGGGAVGGLGSGSLAGSGGPVHGVGDETLGCGFAEAEWSGGRGQVRNRFGSS
jgi:hypothetical protein